MERLRNETLTRGGPFSTCRPGPLRSPGREVGRTPRHALREVGLPGRQLRWRNLTGGSLSNCYLISPVFATPSLTASAVLAPTSGKQTSREPLSRVQPARFPLPGHQLQECQPAQGRLQLLRLAQGRPFVGRASGREIRANEARCHDALPGRVRVPCETRKGPSASVQTVGSGSRQPRARDVRSVRGPRRRDQGGPRSRRRGPRGADHIRSAGAGRTGLRRRGASLSR